MNTTREDEMKLLNNSGYRYSCIFLIIICTVFVAGCEDAGETVKNLFAEKDILLVFSNFCDLSEWRYKRGEARAGRIRLL